MSTALTLLPQDMAALIHTQPPVYKCSRCGQPKKAHICTAPEKLSSAEMSRLKKELSDSKGGEAVRSVWTQEEDRVILAAVLELGPKWGEIAKRLAGRTDHATRNRYHRLTSRGAQVAAELALTDESIVAHPI